MAKNRAKKHVQSQPQPQSEHRAVENVEDSSDAILLKNIAKKCKVQFRNDSQRQYWETIDNHEITLCIGPAGTGKSYLSILKALQMLTAEGSKFKQIICVKPAYEAEEKLGALPGDVAEKLDPYTYSTRYLFSKIIGERRTEKLIERKLLQFVALTYLRGVNIDNAILIFEESQNSSRKGMRTLLTRIGENCKFIINGDIEQIDREFKHGEESGMTFALKKLRGTDGIGVHEFGEKDIVRNPIIGAILKKFNGDIDK
jgi:phosphate starvation-inducible PhoH-like protein